MKLTKKQRRTRIKNRIRKIVSGTEKQPRLSVFRSNKEIYAQLVDDVNGNTLVSSSSAEKEISKSCLLYTSPSPRDMRRSRMPSSA